MKSCPLGSFSSALLMARKQVIEFVTARRKIAPLL
jgi:hypothetical protein